MNGTLEEKKGAKIAMRCKSHQDTRAERNEKRE
jgi:hypothetical protein